jgi:hypothetical protein
MAVVTSSVPEQGQLVTARQRRYVVTEVAKSTLLDRPLKVSAMRFHTGDSKALA